jgi:hypothetical protein
MTNAQIDDYGGLPRRRYAWRPPLHMRVRTRFSHPSGELSGTAGFGFWNNPLDLIHGPAPTLPRALWFFYASPPSDMRLDLGSAGWGWKAATLDALRLPALLAAPTAPLAVPLMNVRSLYRCMWPLYQRALGVHERMLDTDMNSWHTYELGWSRGAAQFSLDGRTVLACATSLRGPLAFVMWLDNQYLVATPWGRLRYGWLDAPGEQWMEVEELAIRPAAPG